MSLVEESNMTEQPNKPKKPKPFNEMTPEEQARNKKRGNRILIGFAVAVALLLLIAFIPTEESGKKESNGKEKAAAKESAPKLTAQQKAKAEAIAKTEALESDVKKNAKQGSDVTAKAVKCTAAGACSFEMQDETLRARESEINRQMGDALDEIFKDTDANTVTITIKGVRVDDLGNETKDSTFIVLTMTKNKWNTLNWENIGDLSPEKLQLVASNYQKFIRLTEEDEDYVDIAGYVG